MSLLLSIPRRCFISNKTNNNWKSATRIVSTVFSSNDIGSARWNNNNVVSDDHSRRLMKRWKTSASAKSIIDRQEHDPSSSEQEQGKEKNNENSGSRSNTRLSNAFEPYTFPFDEKGDTNTTSRSENIDEDLNEKDDLEGDHRLLQSETHAVGYLSKILNARVYDVAIETELQHAKNLSDQLQNNVYLKREDTQPVFSFKIRGAYNKMANLSKKELQRGVVACSAGNHAQGVALSAKMLNCRAIIVMPLATPSIKVNAVRVHGGSIVEVRLFGNNYDEAATEAKRLQKTESLTLIHPFDDPHVIAGQGTIGAEILKECVSKPVDVIFVCCGGGGMLAGIAAYVKQVRPNVKVIGVEAEDAAGMTTSIKEGKIVSLDHVGLFADGAAVKTVGKETFRICSKLVDEMITVNTDQICNAIKLSYNDARVVLEPAGALGIAGLKKYVETNGTKDQTLVAITSGANMDFDRLRFVSERSDTSERTIAVTIPEIPGSFRAMYSLIWPRNVTEFTYRYESNTKAHVLMSFQPLPQGNNSDGIVYDDFEEVIKALSDNGYQDILDLTKNEMAKTHVRHMAGGRSNVRDEKLFRFEFPESPGALQRFLLSLDMHWNVSLFHYRNHGHDFGRVLVGIEVSDEYKINFSNFLDNLGYRFYDETDNPAYNTFLRRD